jgi:hypothetical protein
VPQATSTPDRATVDREKIDSQRVIYRNTGVRCPRKPDGKRVWDGNGKGPYGPGWYVCKYSRRWMTKLWFYEDHRGNLPCAVPSAEGRRMAEPPRIHTKC